MSDPRILPELPPSERLAAAAEKIADNLGALVSLIDELRAEVKQLNITLDDQLTVNVKGS